MPDLTIYKGDTGQLSGWGEKGRRAYEKWRALVQAMEPGEMLHFSYRLPRSPIHHRRFFARLDVLFDMQERFEDVDHLLEFLKVGAGHVDWVPGQDGQIVALPKSIAWHNLDEQGFIEFARAMNDFLWTGYAQSVIWPQLNERQRHAMVEDWFRGPAAANCDRNPARTLIAETTT